MEVALSDADVIIHCGDVLYHGPKFVPVEGYDPAGLAEAINASSAPVLIARGNADSDVDQLVLDVPLQQPYLFAQLDDLRILASHGHLMPPDELVRLCQRWGVNLLLTGHSHAPMVEQHESVMHLNPGSPTYPSAADERLNVPTCAAFIDGRPVIYDLNTGAKLAL